MRARALSSLIATTAVAAASMSLVPAVAATAGPGSLAASALDEVVMTCRTGQVDLNHATVNQIRAAINVDSPVAKRVVGARPYLATKDLLVVEGIGADKLTTILNADNTCATPTQLPPSASDRCSNSTAVDLASATATDIASRLSVSLPNANRIVAARPFATLRHVTPERVPGVGKGVLDKVVAKSCLTPTPIRTATTSWRWAYPSFATTVTRGAYRLTVPADVINDPNGGWASITDADARYGLDDDPAADFHIWTAWADGTQTVEVTLPAPDDANSAEASGLAPVVLHHIDNDVAHTEMFEGDEVRIRDDGATTTFNVEVTSLSPLESLLAPLTYISAPTADRQASERLLRLLSDFTGLSADQPTCPAFSPSDSLRVQTTGTALTQDLAGNRPLIKWCAGPGPNGTARWTVANNSGAVLSVRTQDIGTFVGYNYGGDVLVDALYDLWNYTEFPGGTHQVDLPPGTSAVIQLPPGTKNDQVTIETNELLAVPTFLVRQLGSLLPGESPADTLSLFRGCGVTEAEALMGDAVKTRDIISCVKDAAVASTKPKSLLRKLDRVFFWADVMISTGDTAVVELGGPFNMSLTWRAPAPTIPADQPGNGDINDPTFAAPVRLLKLVGSPASYLLDADGVAHHVLDGGTYVCNSNVMPTQFGLDAVTDAATAVGADATCPTGAPARSLTPQSVRNFLLREPDGTSWYIDESGYRQRVLGDGGFECFADRYLVWDLVSDDEVARFPTYPGVVGVFCQ